ncbi:MAG: nitroreductase family protein [Candidatus Binatia bacterium]
METQARPASTDSDAGIFDIMYTCRAMRRLKPDPVPEELLVKLIEAATQAPSSSNNQCWRFVIVRDRETKQRISEHWRRGWAWYQDALASAPARPGEDLDARLRQRKAGDYMIEHMAEIPALIFVCMKKDAVMAKALQSPRVVTAALRHFGPAGTLRFLMGAGRAGTTGIDSTAYPAVQNLLLAARALGLGTVLTTPHLFTPGAYEEILGIPADVTLTAVLPVGYPKGKFGPVSRPPARTLISWDRYSG